MDQFFCLKETLYLLETNICTVYTLFTTMSITSVEQEELAVTPHPLLLYAYLFCTPGMTTFLNHLWTVQNC